MSNNGNGNGSSQHPGNDDVYENNNSRKQAYDLTDFEQTPLSEIEGLAIAKNPDWYKIQVSPGATSLSVELEFTHAEGNLNLYLYNAEGDRIARSTSKTDNESINLDSPDAGVYYIKVKSVERRGNSYDLVWDDIVPV
ncbi:MAG: PPC domain-containing protein [Lyngbya sp.]|nr:PPC domain-containing protein [Lyngbya sp.]